MKKGLLLINLGSPDALNLRAVGRFLGEFLVDPYVIPLPTILRYILVYGLILPLRVKKSTKAYQSIWTKEGSPLRNHSLSLQEAVKVRVSEETLVAFGMRYGAPSIESALHQLASCDTVTVLPLYPQCAEATTTSSIEKTKQIAKKMKLATPLHFIPHFCKHPAFIRAQSDVIRPYVTTDDHLLFSYHGLPEAQGASYRAQCIQTTEDIARQLNLEKDQYSTSFQSRLGRTPWIKPYTDDMLNTLAKRGIKRLAVTCPSFVADCLETLEEIGMRAKEQWQALGGTTLTLIPALNEHPSWINAIIEMTGLEL